MASTKQALISRGLTDALAEELVQAGHKIGTLKKLAEPALVSLGFSDLQAKALLSEARPPIPERTKLLLFSQSCGYCQNPDCLSSIFPEDLGGGISIAEMAHVIPYGKKGPRHEERDTASSFDPHHIYNLILLCPTCHTRIDKAPESYPRELLIVWKIEHFEMLRKAFGIILYKNRTDVRAGIQSLLDENFAIWNSIGPDNDYQFNPEADEAQIWKRRMRSTIIPNHFRIKSIIRENLSLANGEDRAAFAEYSEHVRGLVERHVLSMETKVPRYPEGMKGIFT